MADESRRVQVVYELDDLLSKEVQKLTRRVQQANDQMEGGAKRAQQGFKGVGASLISLKTVAIGLGAVLTGRVVSAFRRAGSEMEDLTVQFEVLLGSTTAAKDRLKELSEFAARTPFQLPQVAEASKLLERFTKGALSTGDALRIVGDSAAITSERDFAGLAMWVGRAYDALQNNRPAGEAMMRLQELGLVAGDTRAVIEKLQKQARGKEAWNILWQELERNRGGMDKLSQTATGLSSTIKDQLDAAMRQMMEGGAWDAFKGALSGVVDIMQRTIDDGTFEKFGKEINKIGTWLANNSAIFQALASENTKKTMKLRGLELAADEFKAAEKELKEKIRVAELEKNNLEEALLLEKQLAAVVELRKKKEQEILDLKGSSTEEERVNNLRDVLKRQAERNAPSGGGGVGGSSDTTPSAPTETKDAFSHPGFITEDDVAQQIDYRAQLASEELAIAQETADALQALREDEAAKEKALADQQIAEAERAQRERMRIQSMRLATAGQMFGNLADLSAAFAKDEQESTEATRLFQATQTAIYTYSAAQKAYDAMAAIPFVGPGLGATAAAAAIGAGLARVAKIYSAEQGGIVPGGSFTGDHVPARVNSGEMILNRNQQSRLFAIANGGGGGRSINFSPSIVINGGADSGTVAGLRGTLEDQMEAFDRMEARRAYYHGAVA